MKPLKIRISRGIFKGYTFDFPIQKFPKTGLSQQKIKGVIFDILASRLDHGWFLDLFAGSGQMGMEALSLSYSPVLFNELDKRKFSLIKKNLQQLQNKFPALIDTKDILLFSYNALDLLNRPEIFKSRKETEAFRKGPGVVFLDPPFIQTRESRPELQFWYRFFDALANFLQNKDPNVSALLHLPAALLKNEIWLEREEQWKSKMQISRVYGNQQIILFA